jgi:hypothetical protein
LGEKNSPFPPAEAGGKDIPAEAGKVISPFHNLGEGKVRGKQGQERANKTGLDQAKAIKQW